MPEHGGHGKCHSHVLRTCAAEMAAGEAHRGHMHSHSFHPRDGESPPQRGAYPRSCRCPCLCSPSSHSRRREKESLVHRNRVTRRGVAGKARAPTADEGSVSTHSQPPSRNCPQQQPAALPQGPPTCSDSPCRVQSLRGQLVRSPPLPCSPLTGASPGTCSSGLPNKYLCIVTRESDQRQRCSQRQEVVRPPVNRVVSGNTEQLLHSRSSPALKVPPVEANALCHPPPRGDTPNA